MLEIKVRTLDDKNYEKWIKGIANDDCTVTLFGVKWHIRTFSVEPPYDVISNIYSNEVNLE